MDTETTANHIKPSVENHTPLPIISTTPETNTNKPVISQILSGSTSAREKLQNIFNSFTHKTETTRENTSIKKRGETSKRFMMTMRANLEAVINVHKSSVQGLEHLNEIPDGKRVIIVTSHLSDIDVQTAAYALGNYFDIAITNQSTQHEKKEVALRAAMAIAGKDNFLPIEYKRDEQDDPTPSFNPHDYEKFRQALDQGKTLIIAGHNPSYDGVMPAKGGFGAAYMAQLAENTILLPVAISIDKDKPVGISNDKKGLLENLRNKPGARVMIGSPLTFDHVDVTHLNDNQTPAKDRIQSLRIVRSQSQTVMQRLADMLPTSKRGPWNQNKAA